MPVCCLVFEATTWGSPFDCQSLMVNGADAQGQTELIHGETVLNWLPPPGHLAETAD